MRAARLSTAAGIGGRYRRQVNGHTWGVLAGNSVFWIHIGNVVILASYMKNILNISLTTTPEQRDQLAALQQAFAQVCNALAPVVVQTRCWNRVGLHHMTYRGLRERFPQLGSQMVCNAIYSVCRASRAVYRALEGKPLPLLRFLPDAPVFFDRHTLSIKNGQLSMYTLDGRIHFQLGLADEALRRFQEERLREIVLLRDRQGYSLRFAFAGQDSELEQGGAVAELPEFVLVLPQHEAAGQDGVRLAAEAAGAVLPG